MRCFVDAGGLRGTFRSHANYIRALATLAGFPSVTGVDDADRLASRAAVWRQLPSLDDAAVGAPDLSQLRKCLSNAWGTELILALGSEVATEDELVRISNAWAAVQTYYVAFHAFQALLVARGHSRPDSHAKTLYFEDHAVLQAVSCDTACDLVWSADLVRPSQGLVANPAGVFADTSGPIVPYSDDWVAGMTAFNQ